MKLRAVLAGMALLLLGAAPPPPPVDAALILSDALPPKLSDFRFFVNSKPNGRVMAYSLITPLFSDYAEKARYVFVPRGMTATFDRDGVVQFPVGSAIVKSFSYPGRAVPVETRVLLHRASGWVALPYVWTADGKDAVLKRAGTRVDVAFEGRTISYAVPNANQCKECHSAGDAVQPIGPKARNLGVAQMAAWRRGGILAGVSPDKTVMPCWDDARAPLALRARAYLDINCGHCHNPAGAASNSGLNLTWQTTDPTAVGIRKTPVAAGRGSGGRYFAIAPGDPEHSIMIYRLKSVEPGVAMPELGRSMVHREGVQMLSDWIAGMPKS